MSNIHFLQTEWMAVFETAHQAETTVHSDHRAVCFYGLVHPFAGRPDREAAMQAFSEWLQGSTATPNQIEFIEMIVQELTQNGSMDPARLFESPYKDVSAHGPLDIFPPTHVTRIVGVLNEIRQRAVA